jgi:hypothetical protein
MNAAELIYFFCAATSLVAAWLLLRQYARRPAPLLFWSFVGFLGLAANNVLLFVDLGLLPDTDLAFVRTLVGAVAMLTIVFGLIWDADQ